MRLFIKIAQLFLILPISMYAHKKDTLEGASTWRYTQNIGQWESNIHYKSQIKSGAFFLESEKITLVIEDQTAINRLIQYKNSSNFLPPSSPPVDPVIKAHSLQMQFINCNKNCSFSEEDEYADYSNYFIGNDPSKWKSFVKSYQSIIYNQLYPGIDLKVYSNNHYFKYDFIVSPRSDVDQIQIAYHGAEGLSLSKGNLIIKTSITDIVELQPYAYQVIDNKEVKIDCNFEISNNRVKYKLGAYDKSLPLIIDPTLVFATYSGSTADNWGYTATYDKDGNMYSGGSVFGTGYPVTIGAYQTTYGSGNCDISITKFNTTGNTLFFSTYLGGSGTEVPNSLMTNSNNELYVLGTTGSSNFPTTAGCYDNSFNGGTNFTLTYVLQYPTGSDIVLTKFSLDGSTLLGSTFFGGSGNDGLNTVDTLKKNYADEVRGEIMIDANSNVYVVSSTQSLNLPVSSSSFQPIYGGGRQDGCIIKMNQNLTNLIWASYLGGTKSDACYSIQIDRENNIYVAGGTSSLDFPTTPGVINPTYMGGSSDGFISLINENGTSLLASTYFGSIEYDQVYLTKTDRLSNVFLFGQTSATGTTLIQNALWNRPNGGQFLTKLSRNLQSIVWSTTFGTGNGGPDISPTALLVDFCNNIYMSGWGGPALNGFGGTVGLPITPGAFQSTTDNHDYYFIVVKDDASALQYATFFGGGTSHEHVDGGTSRFDKKGRIYQAVCAGCGSNDDFPVTPGSWSTTNNSYNCNMGVIKFDFDVPALIADFDVPSIICAPASVNFINNSSTSTTGTTIWNWSFGDGTYSNQQNPTHTYTQSGQYEIRLIVSNPSSCNTADTMIKSIIVLSNTNSVLPDKNICLGDFVQIGVPPSGNSSITYNWQPPTNLNNTTISNPIANPNATITYLLRISDGVCTDTLTQKVNVYNLQIEAGNNITVCRGDTANLTPITSGGATSFYWSNNLNFDPILNSNITNPNYRPVINGTTTYYVKAKNDYCETIDSVLVTMSFVDITASNLFTICKGDTLTLSATNLYPSTPVNYQWTPTTPIISGGSTSSAIVAPTDTTIFVVTATNSYGCKDTARVKVNTITISSAVATTHVNCYGNCNGQIILNPSGGNTPYTYSWSNSTINTGNTANQLCNGNYTSTITDNHGCKLMVTQTITQPDSLTISFTDTTHVVCNGICSGMARLVASGGTTPYQYTWVNGSMNDSIFNVCAGNYTITVTDFNQCTKTGVIQIRDTSSFDAFCDLQMVRCFSECNGQATIIASNGNIPYIYVWASGSTNDTITNLCSGIYSATVTENNGCIRNVFAEITQPNPLAIANTIINRPNCLGECNGSILVSVTGGTRPYSYQWSLSTSTDSIATNLCSNNYSLTITDANGCTYDTVFIITEPDQLTATIVTTKVPCTDVCNGTATISISGGTAPYSIQWDNGQHLQTATQLCYGNHTVTVIDSNNCTIIVAYEITDTTYYTTQITAWANPETIYESQTSQLNSTYIPGFTYTWTPSTALSNRNIYNPTATPIQTTEYIVHVFDTYGCEKTDTVLITVKDVVCSEPYVYVPNAFTPNIDSKNDIMYVRSDIISSLYFAIYDRWGEKIFETTDINKGWDGTYKGRKCDPAVYVYYIDATCISKEKYIHKGNITLIR